MIHHDSVRGSEADDVVETEFDRQRRLELETFVARVGAAISEWVPCGLGFALVGFELEGAANVAVATNRTRLEVVERLEEIALKVRSEPLS